MATAVPVGCTSLAATDPLYILYTSGTTGDTEGSRARQRRTCRGAALEHAAISTAWNLARSTGRRRTSGGSSVIPTSSTDRSSAGCTTILYEGKPVGTPDPGAFWRVIADHRRRGAVHCSDRVPSHQARRSRCRTSRPLRHEPLQGTLPGGGAVRPGHPGLGTGASWGYRSSTTGGRPRQAGRSPPTRYGIELLPIKPGSAGVPVPGYDVRILDDEGAELEPGEIGSVVIKLPMPPGTLPTLWNNDAGYEGSYLSRYDGYYLTGDAGFKDADGYVSIMSRIDDIINVAGHRLSTGAMEEVLADHPDVAECAVIGVADPLKGQLPVGFVVLEVRSGATTPSMSSPSWWRASESGSARWRPSSRPPSSTGFPRPDRERSSAEPCARSPTARHGRCRPPSTTRPFSTKSAPRWIGWVFPLIGVSPLSQRPSQREGSLEGRSGWAGALAGKGDRRRATEFRWSTATAHDAGILRA